MQTTLVLVLNNTGEGEVYDEGIEGYQKEVPYERKKGVRNHTEAFKQIHIAIPNDTPERMVIFAD